jgi:aconitate hydratase
VVFPARFRTATAGLLPPSPDGRDAPIVKGSNIRDVPVGRPPGDEVAGPVLIKLGDKVSTDDISPSGSQVLVFRSNMPAIAEFTFRNVDPEFVARAKAADGGFILAGQTYGQGSSREAAAVGPMFLGVRAVLAKSFARIHRANLINWGVLPLELADPADYDQVAAGHRLRIGDVPAGLAAGELIVQDETTGRRITVRCALTDRERAILVAGGRLAHTRALGASAA